MTSEPKTALDVVYPELKRLNYVEEIIRLIARDHESATGGAPHKPALLAVELISAELNSLIGKLNGLYVIPADEDDAKAEAGEAAASAASAAVEDR